ncbi:unnamed protein product [Adineta steineri]|uniref:Uncharacterized protein n=1 Tax=Adineta steineri TaxID=433720 RepID=A0A815M352_9BILA|nr:unnamed protein product [Adineta steineri]
MYSLSLTSNSSIYFRYCSDLDSYYEAIQMNVTVTGYYTFLINSEMKTMYAYIYRNNFNPSDVSNNVLIHSEDSDNQGQFRLSGFLEANMKYIFVMTTSSRNVIGNVLIQAFGLSYIGFNRILNTLSVFQTVYTSKLTLNSSTYPFIYAWSTVYYEAIQVNVRRSGYLPVIIGIPDSSTVQSNYSSELTTNSPTYSPRCTQLNYYYETIRMHVGETGYYALTSNSSISTFAYIYKDGFNPMNPFENLLSLSQDYGSSVGYNFKLIAYLHTGTTYILVVTTASANITGNFSIQTFGPNTITLDPYSKYFVSFVNHQQRITTSHWTPFSPLNNKRSENFK